MTVSVTVSESDQDAPWRRLSARMLLVHPVRELGRALPALLGLVVAGRSVGEGQWWWLGPLGVVAVVVLSLLRWATTRYRITPEQVQLRLGLVQRRTVSAPADRVRSVDVTASPLHRLMGLAKVDIGTGGHEAFGGLTLDSLPAAEAAALRAELLHRSAVPSDDAPGTDVSYDAADAVALVDRDTELARLDPRWVRFAPFTMSGILSAGAILGIAWNLFEQLGVPIGEMGIVTGALNQAQRIPVWLDLLAGMVALVAFVTILSMGGYVLSYWGFRLSRHAQGSLHVTRGLLTTRATSIEERRLRGVELVEPLLLRAVHAARLSGITTGLKAGGGLPGGSALLLPPAPLTVVREVATQVLGDPKPVEVSLTSHGPAARRRRFARALLVALLLVAAAGVALSFGAPQWVAIPAVLTVPIAAMLAMDRYRSLGHALAGSHLVTRAGSISRRRDVVALEGIIGWNLDQTFFQRRSGLATLSATTAAGKQWYAITDVPLELALSLGNRALPGLLSEFLEPANLGSVRPQTHKPRERALDATSGSRVG